MSKSKNIKEYTTLSKEITDIRNDLIQIENFNNITCEMNTVYMNNEILNGLYDELEDVLFKLETEMKNQLSTKEKEMLLTMKSKVKKKVSQHNQR